MNKSFNAPPGFIELFFLVASRAQSNHTYQLIITFARWRSSVLLNAAGSPTVIMVCVLGLRKVSRRIQKVWYFYRKQIKTLVQFLQRTDLQDTCFPPLWHRFYLPCALGLANVQNGELLLDHLNKRNERSRLMKAACLWFKHQPVPLTIVRLKGRLASSLRRPNHQIQMLLGKDFCYLDLSSVYF